MIVSFFSVVVYFIFPPLKRGLQHNWGIAIRFGLYRGVVVWTVVRTVVRSVVRWLYNQNFSDGWVNIFSYPGCSARARTSSVTECTHHINTGCINYALKCLNEENKETKKTSWLSRNRILLSLPSTKIPNRCRLLWNMLFTGQRFFY